MWKEVEKLVDLSAKLSILPNSSINVTLKESQLMIWSRDGMEGEVQFARVIATGQGKSV